MYNIADDDVRESVQMLKILHNSLCGDDDTDGVCVDVEEENF